LVPDDSRIASVLGTVIRFASVQSGPLKSSLGVVQPVARTVAGLSYALATDFEPPIDKGLGECRAELDDRRDIQVEEELACSDRQ
jgi:hypothetical protein